MASKIIFSRSNTEKVTALLIPHSAFDAFCEKRKLICGWLLARPPILACASDNLRSSVTNHLLFRFRPRIGPGPSIPGNAPVYAHATGLLRRNVALGAPTFGALENVMDETGALDFLAGKSHLSIAFDAERLVGLQERLDHAAIQAKAKKAAARMT
jgi:hypothetical protein